MRPRLVAGVATGFILLLLATSSAAAAAPRKALLKARSEVRGLAKHASTSAINKPAGAAVRQLGLATFKELWIDPSHTDAPAYGARIFTRSTAAVRDLQKLPGSGPAGAITLIVGAQRALASVAIKQAVMGNAALLGRANDDLKAGDRAHAKGRVAKALRSYKNAWQTAFAALTGLVVAKVTNVPPVDLGAAAEEALGNPQIGLVGPMPPPGKQPPLTAGGKPEMFFAGSEACPFCGVERWGMIVALSQFGTFANLHLMQSDPTEQPADTTFTFFGSSYSSPYISFVPVEVWSNVRKGFAFKHLQPLTASQHALLQSFDPPAQTPFIDVGNGFINIGATVKPNLIAKLSWTEVADSLTNPSSAPAQAIAGEAEVLTAELCETTNGNPASVCSSPVVKQYEAALPLLNGRGGGCPLPAASDQASAQSTRDRSRRHTGPLARVAKCIG